MVGKTVSHYRVEEQIGGGGMGVVYRAHDARLGRDVALKFLPEPTDDKLVLDRFLREARAAAALNHPNICTVHEIGEQEGQPFIVMELLEGHTLKHRIERGPFPPRDLVDLALQMADALVTAHARGVTHRDIKPANIFLTRGGQIKVLDFGLAKLAARQMAHALGEGATLGSNQLTSPGSTLGTVGYMSPEQVRGEDIDARSDLFSLGVVLYEMATGKPAFPGATSGVIFEAILNRTPPPLLESNASLPAELERILNKTLEKDRDLRYQSAAELRADLKRLKRDLESGIRTASKRSERAAPAPAAAPTDNSIAVLYFENLSPDTEDQYFRDGMTEDIITELSKIKGLRVLSRQAVMPYRDRGGTASEIGEALGAACVLQGTLRRAGKRLRITAQLLETSTGHSMWAERYDSTMEDVFAIQDEISQSIAKALRVVLSDKEKEEIAKAPTVDVEAYDYYLRGRQFFHHFRRKSLEFAQQMFRRAIEIDPGYARAHAGVADCSSFLYTWWDASPYHLREADKFSRRALDLDPELAEAHASRGFAASLNKNYQEAYREFETAISLNPQLFEAYYFYARACFAEGRLEKAAELYEKAAEVRPEDYQTPSLLGTVYDALGRKEDAKRTEMTALQRIRKHIELYPDDARALYLGAFAYARFGDYDRAREWAEKARAIDSEDPAVLYNVACVYCILGETEQGLRCLQRAIENGFGQREWIEHDTDLDALRSDPRFQELLKFERGAS